MPPVIRIEIPRMDGGFLVVEDAAALAEVFFATEVSSLGAGSYDARTLTTHPNRVDEQDVFVMNSSFRAMIMKTQLWAPWYDAGDLAWLAVLDPDWDVAELTDAEWAGASELVQAAIAEVISVKGRGVAQATKLLHLKRPALVPVIDSFVAKAVGGRLSGEVPKDRQLGQAAAILEHFRVITVELTPQLTQIADYLRSVGVERSLVRILDGLVWCSEADAWVALAATLARWRTEPASA